MNTPRIRMARLVRAAEADRSFDLEFWRKAGHEARFAAAWQMVSEVSAIRGEEVGESRLQRSVQSIQRQRS
jgi:hypothetical protein